MKTKERQLIASMSRAIQRLWSRPPDAPSILENAQRREHGLETKTLYPSRPGEWKAASRETAKKED